MKAWEPPRIMTTDEENYFTRPQIDTPTPDLLALLKRCRPWIEHERDYYKNKGDASFESATKANAMISAAELDALLSDLAKAGVK